MESETNNFLKWVEIKNFKSIKDLRMDCKRVNVFIGKPNVGKSNILEGLGLLAMVTSRERMFDGYIRYESLKQLFYDSDSSKAISVRSSSRNSYLSLNRNSDEEIAYFDYGINGLERQYRLTENGRTVVTSGMDSSSSDSFIKKYDFANLTNFPVLFQKFLLPPNGSNLYEVIRRNKDLWGEFAKLFSEQRLELVLYDDKQEFILQKKDGPYVWQYPFFSIADTFRRFMFYITAIESNKNSVIIFEEPEVHSFPPYTQEMAYRMIYDEDNQYFISTHSPYLLHTLIENLDNNHLNVYITYYENYETKVKLLTPDNLREVLDFSIDVFFNLDKFLVDVVNA